MIFTCPKCEMSLHVRVFPVHCCGTSHGAESAAIADGELLPRVKRKKTKSRPAVRTGIEPCTHRGDELRRIICAPCGGAQIKVFGCDIHGECTIAKPMGEVACCSGCSDKTMAPNIFSPVTDGRLRVGFVTPSYVMPGGAERWIQSIIRHCDPRVMWSGVAVTSRGGTSQELIDATDCIVSTSPHAVADIAACSDVLIVWGLRRVRDYVPNFAGQIVVVSHGCGEWTAQHLDDPTLREDDVRIAVSKASASSFPAGVNPIVCWNGIDPSRVETSEPRHVTRERVGLRDDEIAVGYVGRYSWEKNPVAAAQAVTRLGPPYRAVYVGDGWQACEVMNSVRAICPDTIFVPSQSHVGNVLAAIDCFVLASPSEGMSLGLIEAWAAGVSTVSTPVGAVPELEERFGQLTQHVPVDTTPEQLAAAVRAAIADPYTVDRARVVARTHLTAEQMTKRIINTVLNHRTESELFL